MHIDPSRYEHALFWAWVAGFVDGEGCLTVMRQNWRARCHEPSYTAVLMIKNCERAPLEEIQVRAGAGGIATYRRPAGSRSRTAYNYSVWGESALRFVAAIRPYLRIKGPQADILLRFPILGRGWRRPDAARIRAEQAALYAAIREANRRGIAPG